MSTENSACTDTATASAPAGSIAAKNLPETLAAIRPLFEIDRLAAKVLEEMGLGTVETTTDVDGLPPTIDFSVAHFVILPQKSVWLDFVLETDRASALAIYELFSGTSGASDADLEDVLRETMNLIHGSLKIAFKKEDGGLIIPVVPQSVAVEKTLQGRGGFSLQSRHVFKLPGIALRLTMSVRVAPITRKHFRDIRISNVLTEPLKPDGNEELVIVKQGTMLNQRTLEKVQGMADYEPDTRTLPVIEPSPLAESLGLQ